jgi:AcrR family transcriptional regulator
MEPLGPAAEARRREILGAASRLFRERGLHEAGMREIAAALGMTAGNLYYYFGSKQELLAYCQESALAALLGLAAETCALPERADARLFRLLAGHVHVLNASQPGSLAHLEIEALPAPARSRLLAQRRRYERAYRELIEAGIATGVFRAADPRLATLALLGAVNWTVKWFDSGGRKSAEAVGDEFAELLVRGLLAPGVELERPAAGVTASTIADRPRRQEATR